MCPPDLSIAGANAGLVIALPSVVSIRSLGREKILPIDASESKNKLISTFNHA